jgi:hypothetical protein
MFLPEGNRTAAVDALWFAWSGKWPPDRSPMIGPAKIQIVRQGAQADDGKRLFAPGARLSCSVDASDPEGQPLTIRWDVRRDVSDAPQTGGDREPATPPIEGTVVQASGKEAAIQLPQAPGNYRIFVYALDPAGNAATVNVPVRVE